VLSSQDEKDPKALLDAVRDACQRQNVVLTVRRKPADPADPPDEKRVALEHLEAAALNAAAALLEMKAEEARQAEGQATGAAGKRKRKAQEEVVAARKGVWVWVKEKAAAGWSITVKAGLDWVKGQVAGGGTPGPHGG
jgi:hypothetical protein